MRKYPCNSEVALTQVLPRTPAAVYCKDTCTPILLVQHTLYIHVVHATGAVAAWTIGAPLAPSAQRSPACSRQQGQQCTGVSPVDRRKGLYCSRCSQDLIRAGVAL